VSPNEEDLEDSEAELIAAFTALLSPSEVRTLSELELFSASSL
jgi:hypothetical protein